MAVSVIGPGRSTRIFPRPDVILQFKRLTVGHEILPKPTTEPLSVQMSKFMTSEITGSDRPGTPVGH